MQPSSPKTTATLVGFMAGFMVTGLLVIAGSGLIMAIWNQAIRDRPVCFTAATATSSD